MGDPERDSYGPRYCDLLEGELTCLPSSDVLELLFLGLTGNFCLLGIVGVAGVGGGLNTDTPHGLLEVETFLQDSVQYRIPWVEVSP